MFNETKVVFSESKDLKFEQVKRARHLLSIEQKGIRQTPDTLGYLSATVQEMDELIDTGLLQSLIAYEPTNIEFIPTPTRAREIKPDLQDFNPLITAKNIIGLVPQEQAFLSAVGGSHALQNREHIRQAIELFYNLELNPDRVEKGKNFFSEKLNKTNKNSLDELISQAQEFKGFILLISRSALQKYETNESSKIDIDMWGLHTADGLPYEYLSGLQALGPWERKYMDALKRKVK